MDNQPLRSGPKDVFLQLFNIFTFYLGTIALITLFIQYISALFPDTLNYFYSGVAQGVRWSMSILFVAVPAYLLTAWILAKDLAIVPEKRELKLRKWLIYFTLFISAITIIIDLMVFVYNFLNGELTMRFFLKVLVVLLIASGVFGYYIWELKRKNLNSKVPKILALSLSVFVVVSIIAGFFIVGTPGEQRKQRFDEQRIQNLQNVQNEIINYWTAKKELPQNLDALKNNISGFIPQTDPETKVAYEYNILAPLKFELCANFNTSNKEGKFKDVRSGLNYGYNDPYNQNWEHTNGRVCFTRDIDPALYKDSNPAMMVK